MSATVAAALKKIAVYILTDKKALKVVGGIILGIIIIIIMPIVALLGIFTGSVDIDTDRLHEMIAEQQSVAIESWSNVETAMTNAGYDSLRTVSWSEVSQDTWTITMMTSWKNSNITLQNGSRS